MGFFEKKSFSMAVRTSMALTAILVLSGCEKKNEAMMYLNDMAISQEEYSMLAKEKCNQIYMQYSTEEVNDENFWNEIEDGITRYEKLDQMIIEELKENYAMKELSVDLGIIEEYTFEQLMEQKIKDEAAGQQYGLNEYEQETYYEHWYSNLETNMINQWIESKNTVTKEDCKKYYEEHLENYMYDTGVTIYYTEILPDKTCQEEEIKKKAEAVYQIFCTERECKAAIKQIPDVTIEELELNDQNKQEGASGIYEERWNIACQLEEGEVCQPYEQNGVYCVIKCIERVNNGRIEYEEAKTSIERYLQIQEVKNEIEEKKETLKVISDKKDRIKVLEEVIETR